jgi:hypothetical protein
MEIGVRHGTRLHRPTGKGACLKEGWREIIQRINYRISLIMHVSRMQLADKTHVAMCKSQRRQKGECRSGRPTHNGTQVRNCKCLYKVGSANTKVTSWDLVILQQLTWSVSTFSPIIHCTYLANVAS